MGRYEKCEECGLDPKGAIFFKGGKARCGWCHAGVPRPENKAQVSKPEPVKKELTPAEKVLARLKQQGRI